MEPNHSMVHSYSPSNATQAQQATNSCWATTKSAVGSASGPAQGDESELRGGVDALGRRGAEADARCGTAACEHAAQSWQECWGDCGAPEALGAFDCVIYAGCSLRQGFFIKIYFCSSISTLPYSTAALPITAQTLRYAMRAWGYGSRASASGAATKSLMKSRWRVYQVASLGQRCPLKRKVLSKLSA